MFYLIRQKKRRPTSHYGRATVVDGNSARQCLYVDKIILIYIYTQR